MTGPDLTPDPLAAAGTVEPAESTESTEPVRAGLARPSWRAIALWLVATGAAVAIDGVVGGLALVFVAAVVLAGISARVIGAVGVLLLAAAPMAVLFEGIPSDADVSPLFVTRSLLPHHLTFAGLILVCSYALIDLAPHLRDWAQGDHPVQDDGPPFGTVVGVAVVAVVAVGALAACVAVLRA